MAAWIVLSVALAFALRLLPFPVWAQELRPDWVVLVVIYWVVIPPHRLGVMLAFVIGLMLDGVSGTLLGEHAFCLVMITYFAQLLHRPLLLYPWWQRIFWVVLLVFFYQTLLLLIQSMLGEAVDPWLFWVPALSSGLIWLWMSRMGRLNLMGDSARISTGF